MKENDWFVMRPRKAQAYGRLTGDGFLVREGSTAMREGSPGVKRDREERDRLVRQGVLVPDSDPDLYRFSRDHLFGSSSAAGGIVKDGNCSGPQSWRRPSDGKSIKDVLR
ncbi:DUF4357 domain-containing protein [Rhizobium ruizarguesonis]|uniref:DUF4357 domain-containing protein n=1 Tax=Rhizobium ruizarguesonis TaxID=2081791 RepID=UPI00102F5438|nr:DUF4357 domain-containing protein [Rhizobium ruizarguesonis]TAZ88158.1 DUF4357 domain-containing protein [Rhizobium ruizarguesonis]TBA29460.1 DUF4357 domain-containing protein [Rhizobium ruizarguesonis]TBA73892.1 DUF4357 domain-containing protein [Rhizobium ruizarguesonis]TBC54098.1 DUF4357 domain-containing protein [Rhizobium ruizarguesonis]